MSKSTHRYLFVIVLLLIGVSGQHVTSSAQEPAGAEDQGARSNQNASRTSNFSRQPAPRTVLAQFGGGGGRGVQPGAEEPSLEQPLDMIALTVWSLTISHASGPESDVLVGKLIDRANSLPPVIGTTDDVRELISRLKTAGLVRKSHEYHLLTLDGQQVTSQAGANHPMIVATNATNRGRSNNIQFSPVGTTITATPQIDSAARVQVRLEYAASSVESAKDAPLDAPAEGDPTFANQTLTLQLNTTVRLKSGTAVLLRSESSQESGDDSPAAQTRLIILGANVLPALDEAESNTSP